MLNWIKNLFTSSPAPVAAAPYKLEAPVVEAPVELNPTATWPFPTSNKPDATVTPKATAKPKVEPKKKAAPKTASKKPAAIKSTKPKKV